MHAVVRSHSVCERPTREGDTLPILHARPQPMRGRRAESFSRYVAPGNRGGGASPLSARSKRNTRYLNVRRIKDESYWALGVSNWYAVMSLQVFSIFPITPHFSTVSLNVRRGMYHHLTLTVEKKITDRLDVYEP